MKKLKLALLILLAAAFAAVSVAVILKASSEKTEALSCRDISSITDEELIEYASEILEGLRQTDLKKISKLVHPKNGLVLSPDATVNLQSDRSFTASQVAGFFELEEKYIWGVDIVTGEPVEMTTMDFYNRYINAADFTLCCDFGVDRVIRTGNSLENIPEVFPDARFVDCYMPDPVNARSGMGWKSLRLVFEEYDGRLYLSAIVYSENTL